MMKERNIEIDIMKGIAILCVMLGHTTWIPGWLGTFIYSFHMPLFFIVSGYFLKSRDEYPGNGWDILRKNAKQLLIPYVVVTFLSCIYPLFQALYYDDMSIVTHKLLAFIFAFDTVWEGTVFDTYVAPIWFLLALFWARLFFYWLSKAGKWFIPLCMALSFAMIYAHPYAPTPFCLSHALVGLIFMVIGWAYRNYHFPIWSKVLAVGCWLVSMSFGAMDLFLFRYSIAPINIIGACGGTYVIYLISKGLSTYTHSFILSLLHTVLAWCGRNSLIILCAHTLESGITIIHVLTKFLPFKLPSVFYFGIRHAVTLAGAYVYTLCRRGLHINRRSI